MAAVAAMEYGRKRMWAATPVDSSAVAELGNVAAARFWFHLAEAARDLPDAVVEDGWRVTVGHPFLFIAGGGAWGMRMAGEGAGGGAVARPPLV
jgi:hypothetical protein